MNERTPFMNILLTSLKSGSSDFFSIPNLMTSYMYPEVNNINASVTIQDKTINAMLLGGRADTAA